MAASTEQAVLRTLRQANLYRGGAENAAVLAMAATIAFMDEARAAAWSWELVGAALTSPTAPAGITSTAARRYYERNRRKVRNGG